MHGLTDSQLSELQGAVQALDSYLLLCVDDLRNNRWDRPNAKHVADCLVRELVRTVSQRFQVNPTGVIDAITLDHRTKLLTRRVRAIMRAFNKNRNYLSETPNITWDDSFIPPELYDDFEIEPENLEEEKASEKLEKQMSKEKAKVTQNNKGKTKEADQNKDNTENLKKKWTRKTSESSQVVDIADSEDGTSFDEDEPPAKRVKRKKTIDETGIIPASPPCRQCTSSRIECKPNGWSAACKNCRKARRTCSLSKVLRNDKGKGNETAKVNEKPDDTEKHRTHSIMDDRSTEDEDVDQLDEVPAMASPNKKKVTMDGFIPYDPKCDRCERCNKECGRREDQDQGARCTYCAKLKKGCTLTDLTLKDQSKINFVPNNPKCDRCERFKKECVRRDAQDHGARCTNCTKSKQECSLTSLKGQSKFKVNFMPNDPKCERCERSHKECVRGETDRGIKCRQCVKDHQVCKFLSKGQSKITKFTKSKPTPKASNSMGDVSSSSSNSHNFELELMQQQLKASQEDLRIAQQQLQLANSRIESQRDLYEAQLAGYRGQGSGKVKR